MANCDKCGCECPTSEKRCDECHAKHGSPDYVQPADSQWVARRYAVSSGNGNDGVSHYWPDYIVTTDDPWTLARLAALTAFKPEFQSWAADNLDVDGDEEYGIQAMILDPPADEDESNDEESGFWSDANGAWRLWNVYSADEVSDDSSAPEYDSLEACFGADVVAVHIGEKVL
jgi:hypothetical protein